MDWIEQLFGWSPDNGDGTFELFLMLLAVAVVAAGILAFSRTARGAFLRLATALLPHSLRKR
jgi:hypothetical protein